MGLADLDNDLATCGQFATGRSKTRPRNVNIDDALEHWETFVFIEEHVRYRAEQNTRRGEMYKLFPVEHAKWSRYESWSYEKQREMEFLTWFMNKSFSGFL